MMMGKTGANVGPGAYNIEKADNMVGWRRRKDICLTRIEPFHYLKGSGVVGLPGFTMAGNQITLDEDVFLQHQKLVNLNSH